MPPSDFPAVPCSLLPGSDPTATGTAGRLARACRVSSAPDFDERPTSRSTRVCVGSALVSLLLSGCARTATGVDPIYPAATVYERDPQFIGEWVGEVGSTWGVLTLGELEPHRFFGSFLADDGSVEYVLMLDQSRVKDSRGAVSPSNRVTFTWQDGQGGRGRGWLLINREGTALTGSHGYDNAIEGLGQWTLIRSDT